MFFGHFHIENVDKFLSGYFRSVVGPVSHLVACWRQYCPKLPSNIAQKVAQCLISLRSSTNKQQCYNMRTSKVNTEIHNFHEKPTNQFFLFLIFWSKELWVVGTKYGFCIPEPLPVHTGIKGRQVHPLIRFCVGAGGWEECWSPQSRSSLFWSRLDVTVAISESLSHQRFPWALQLKEQILKEQITDDRVFFKEPFRPCPSGCGSFLSADDGHDRCLQCLGRRHAEAAFVDDSCVCCGRMSMISLRSRLPLWKDWLPLPPPVMISLARAEDRRLTLWEIWGLL